MDSNLKKHQREAIDRILSKLESDRVATLLMPTGVGKSRIIQEVALRVSRVDKVLVLVDRLVLLSQIESSFKELGENIAVSVSSTYAFHEVMNDKGSRIVLSTVQLVESLQEDLEGFGYIVASDISSKWFESGRKLNSMMNAQLSSPKMFFSRSFISERDIELFGGVDYEYSIEQGIEDGYFVPFEYKRGRTLKENRSAAEFGYIANKVSSLMENNGNKVLIVCSNISEMKILKDLLEQAISIEILSISSKDENVSRNIFSFFKTKEQSIALIVDMFAGLHIPDLTHVLFLRTFKSHVFLMQAVSLVIRRFEGKSKGVIWDFGGNRRLLLESWDYFNLRTSVIEQYDKGNLDEKISEEFTSDDDFDATSTESNLGEERVPQKRIAPVGDNSSNEDLLGRGPLVHIISGIIEKVDSTEFRPFVIALLGKWGAGKSTVINLIIKKLEESNKYKFLNFNAWQNEHCNNMGAAIASGIVDVLFTGKRFLPQMEVLLKYHFGLSRSRIKIALVVMLFLLFPAAIFFDAQLADKISEPKNILTSGYSSAIPFILTLFISAYAYFKNPFTTRLRSLLTKPNYSEHLGLSNKIKDDLKVLLNSDAMDVKDIFKKEEDRKKQYIVIIDDLDRCSDTKIFEVLEAVKLIVDLPNVIVILAVDQDILLSAVANRFIKQNSRLSRLEALSLGRDFLGKIIQLSIELDSPHPIHMEKFISERLYSNVENSEDISNNIMSGSKISDESKFSSNFESFAEDYEPPGFFSGESEDEFEEEISEYEESEDYLASSEHELKIFSSCVGAFDISNPRTLVRIHNSITLLKGIYPEVMQTQKELQLYIFFSFLHEVYSSSSAEYQKELESVFGKESSANTRIERLRLFANSLGVDSLDIAENRLIYSRVKRYSLPTVKLPSVDDSANNKREEKS